MATVDEILFFVFVGGIGGGPLLALFCVGCCECLAAIGRIEFDDLDTSARDAYQPVIQREISPYV
jgi:hypothetical protein